MPLATALLSAAKEQLTITACTVSSSGKISNDSSKVFKALLNPENYQRKYEIVYSKSNKSFGEVGSDQKFEGYAPEVYNFSFTVDGTGVVSDPMSEAIGSGTGGSSVTKQLDQLNSVIYDYSGSKHEPNVVELLWGTLIVNGRLEEQNVEYTLFSPTGEPLRAKVTLKFGEFLSKSEEKLRANRSSPDLTHAIEVKAGDTLPLLCETVYNDSAYYLAVAEANGLDHFRNIRPGQKLFFPPLG